MRKGRRAFLLSLASAFLAACRAALTPEPTTSQPTQTATAPPTATEPAAVPEPTITPSEPAPTATREPTRVTGISSQIAYTLPLVTRIATADSAQFFFEFNQPAGGVLIVWPEENPAEQILIPFDSSTRRHRLPVTGLTPGQRYRAVVGVETEDGFTHPHYINADEQWGEIGLRTLPADGPLRFGVIGDAGFGEQTTYLLVEQMANADLDFVIHTGDVVYDIEDNASAEEAWLLKWFLPFAPVLKSMPVYPVIGNHDYDPEARWQDTYFYYNVIPPITDEQPNSQYYMLPHGDVQFIFFDSQVLFGQPGRQQQEAWLGERLADPAYRWTIPVFHVAAYTSGRRTDSDSVPVRQTWGAKFGAANVPVAFSGHDHNYERLIIGDTTYIVSGGGSNSLYDMESEMEGSQYFEKVSHTVWVTIHADRIELQAVAADGRVIDTALIPLA
ncbi:MAG: metallophosphoesterase [Anaerolineae bacterium]